MYHPNNVWVLLVTQSLMLIVMPALIFAGSFIGLALAPSSSLATLPVAAPLIAVAFFAAPVSRIFKRYGRKSTIVGLALFACACSLLAYFAVQAANFWLLIAACSGLGLMIAGAQQMRYAALESVAPEQGPTALARIMLGGIVVAFLGPEIALQSRDLLSGNYSAMFLVLAAMQLAAAALLFGMFREPELRAESAATGQARRWTSIIKQPVLLAALLSSISAFGIMSLIMVATPMSMHHMSGHSMESSKIVIQSHLLAMFLPSLISPWLIRKVGIYGLLVGGIAAYALCFAIALAGEAVIHYWLSLVLLGLGWNFLFTGATALLPQSYNNDERHMVQSWNDLSTFSVQALTSIFSAWLLFNFSWQSLMYCSALLLVVNLLMVVNWRRRARLTTN